MSIARSLAANSIWPQMQMLITARWPVVPARLLPRLSHFHSSLSLPKLCRSLWARFWQILGNFRQILGKFQLNMRKFRPLVNVWPQFGGNKVVHFAPLANLLDAGP